MRRRCAQVFQGRLRRGVLLVRPLGVVLLLAACENAPPSPPTPAATPSPLPVTRAAPTLPPPTATPAPSPTPNLAVIEAQAVKARVDGDTGRAVELYQQAITLLPDSEYERRRETRFQQARLQYEAGQLAPAIDTLRTLISETVQISGTANSGVATYHTLLGRALEAAADPINAAQSYRDAIMAGSVISPYLNLWLGNYYIALNTPVSAVVPYQAAAAAAPSIATEFERRELLALALLRAAQPAEALAQYESILARAQIANYRARIQWEAAQAQLAAGQRAAAYQRLQDLIVTHERTPQALLALKALLDAGQPVDELQRGKVNYHAKQYAQARAAFRRAIDQDGSPARLDEIRLWAARNYIALNLPNDALRNLDQTLAAGNAAALPDAHALRIEVALGAGNVVSARRQLSAFRASKPRPELCASVGLAFERADLAEDALTAYQACPGPQPRVATLLLQLNRPVEAEAVLVQLAAGARDASEASFWRLWLSRAQIAAGKTVTGEATLRALAADLPDTYEGVRASQIVSQTRFVVTHTAAEFEDWQAGQAEAEAWLRSWNGVSDTVDVRSPDAALLTDDRYLRGVELWRLGFEPEATDEFAGLINAHADHPLRLYQMALRFQALGAYRMSIRAADTLMRRSPAKTPTKLPDFLARLIYPAYYADLVDAAAKEFDVNPLLILSVMRQESLFEPFAESSAAAAGLMQVIPSTGAEIHRELGWPAGYSVADLSKPYVSVRFGAYYLAKQRKLFDANLFAMLAAYNGGPGNALRWRARAGDDPDAFAAAVTFDETRRYLTAITVNMAQYTRLYANRS